MLYAWWVFWWWCCVPPPPPHVDVCIKISPTGTCICRSCLSPEWKTVSLSAVPDEWVILLSLVANLLAALWLDGGQRSCASGVVCLALCCVAIPVDRRSRRGEGAGAVCHWFVMGFGSEHLLLFTTSLQSCYERCMTRCIKLALLSV